MDLTKVWRGDILIGMKRTTIHLGDKDHAAIKLIREQYGMDTDSAAIRFALRIMADAEVRETLRELWFDFSGKQK